LGQQKQKQKTDSHVANVIDIKLPDANCVLRTPVRPKIVILVDFWIGLGLYPVCTWLISSVCRGWAAHSISLGLMNLGQTTNSRVIAEDQSGYSLKTSSQIACVPEARLFSESVQSCSQGGCGVFAYFCTCR